MDTHKISHIEAFRDELMQTIGDIETLVRARTLLADIVAETKPEPDGARLVAIGGGWRRLPDDMARLINEAAELVR